ncbi:MAG: hypothetical protein ACI8ZO_001280 [Flavobacteriales bacterium]|jgi:hypothetical protein
MKRTSNISAKALSFIAVFFLSSLLSIQAQNSVIQGGSSPSQAMDVSSVLSTTDLKFIEISGFTNSSNIAVPDCWNIKEKEVWLKFSAISTGDYTFNTNVGTKVFQEDNRIALYKASNGVLGDLLACNEIVNKFCSITETSGISYRLTQNQDYFIRLGKNFNSPDLIGLIVYEIRYPENDCIGNAKDIQVTYNQINTERFVASSWQMYASAQLGLLSNSAFVEDKKANPTYLASTEANDQDENICKSASQSEFKDVWYKFSYNRNKRALVNVYDLRDMGLYGIQVFRKTENFPSNICESNRVTSGLERLGCSAPDGQVANSVGDEDWAKGDFTSHARINLSELGLNNNDEVYLRVYALDGATQNSCSEAFQLVFEQTKPSNSVVGSDGVSYDNIKNSSQNPLNQNSSGADFYGFYSGLSNAGMRGGLNSTNGATSTITPRKDEIGNYYGQNIASSCQDDDSELVEGLQFSNNNSALYSFVVENTLKYGPFDVIDTMSEDIVRDSFFVENTIKSGPFDFPDTSDDFSAFPRTLLRELSGCLGISVDRLITILLDDSKDFLLGPCAGYFTSCSANVTLTLSNIKFGGVPGNTIELVVLPNIYDNDTDPLLVEEPMFISLPTYACSQDKSFTVELPYLSSGGYSIVVDGESGNLTSYDLEFDILYVDPNTDVPCNEASNSNQRVMNPELAISQTEDSSLELKVSPMPIRDVAILEIASHNASVYQLRVWNINGQVVESRSIAVDNGINIIKLDMNAQQAGIYFLELTNADKLEIFKLIKQ